MALTDVSGTGVDASFVDLTAEEVVAIAAMLDVLPPLQIVGPEPPDPEAITIAAGIGRRSLIARRLARTIDGVEQIEQLLAESIRTTSNPQIMTIVTKVSEADQAITWLYLDETGVTVVSNLEDGLYRLRRIPGDAFGPALELVSGLDDTTGAPMNGFVIDIGELSDAMEAGGGDTTGSAVEEATDHLRASVLASALGSQDAEGGEATSVSMLWRSEDNADQVTSIVWYRNGAGQWSHVTIDGRLITGEPSSPSAIIGDLRAALPPSDAS